MSDLFQVLQNVKLKTVKWTDLKIEFLQRYLYLIVRAVQSDSILLCRLFERCLCSAALTCELYWNLRTCLDGDVLVTVLLAKMSDVSILSPETCQSLQLHLQQQTHLIDCLMAQCQGNTDTKFSFAPTRLPISWNVLVERIVKTTRFKSARGPLLVTFQTSLEVKADGILAKTAYKSPTVAPIHAVPIHAAPIHAVLNHAAPIHAAPIHAVPIHAAPIHTAPIHTAPMHAAPIHAHQSPTLGATCSRAAVKTAPVIETKQISNTLLGQIENQQRASPTYQTIAKHGDDLRRDQMMLQMFTLIDALWKQQNIDCCLTLYRVLATSASSGLIEFVRHAHSITTILDCFPGHIKEFLEYHHPKASQREQAMDVFVRSCAGYSVLTYVFGIGDRHLDNLLVLPDGHLFHIDFGYLFGEDPKPFPPPMKLCQEMVVAMGGIKSVGYHAFRRWVVKAFLALRPFCEPLLHALQTMLCVPIKEAQSILAAIRERFQLDKSPLDAEMHILSIVDASLEAIPPLVVDVLHKWAMYWK